MIVGYDENNHTYLRYLAIAETTWIQKHITISRLQIVIGYTCILVGGRCVDLSGIYVNWRVLFVDHPRLGAASHTNTRLPLFTNSHLDTTIIIPCKTFLLTYLYTRATTILK